MKLWNGLTPYGPDFVGAGMGKLRFDHVMPVSGSLSSVDAMERKPWAV